MDKAQYGLTKAGKPRKRPARKEEGRPEIVFTDEQWDEFEKLCAFQCTEVEICNWFNVDDVTLVKLLKERYDMSFSEAFAQKRTKGLVSLRRLQFQLAKSNPAMAIFLGKNYLDQKDRKEIELTTPNLLEIIDELDG